MRCQYMVAMLSVLERVVRALTEVKVGGCDVVVEEAAGEF